MNGFIEDVEIYLNNMNASLIERGQIIDSLEVLQEKIEDLNSAIPEGGDRKPLFRVQSLIEVILITFRSNQATDEDAQYSFESCYRKYENKTEVKDYYGK